MRATLFLVVLNVVVYVAMLVVSASTYGTGELLHFHSPVMEQFGANDWRKVLDGEWWRLFDATLMHFGIWHLLGNMAALWSVGRMLEPRWGGARVIATYLVTGVLASATSLAWYSSQGERAIAAGASGAICGLIGAAVIAFHAVGDARRRNGALRWGVIVIVLGLAIGADTAAHVGGFFVGIVSGALVEKVVGVPRRKAPAVDAVAILGFLALAAAGFGVALFG